MKGRKEGRIGEEDKRNLQGRGRPTHSIVVPTLKFLHTQCSTCNMVRKVANCASFQTFPNQVSLEPDNGWTVWLFVSHVANSSEVCCLPDMAWKLSSYMSVSNKTTFFFFWKLENTFRFLYLLEYYSQPPLPQE